MTITSPYSTPAMKRAREREQHEIQALKAAEAELANLAKKHSDWPPMDLMLAVVRKTGISLATVNLAYDKFEKSSR
ncbi:hypothetical protein [Mycolicibacterium wolinskyi]|uniref:hypothetical protein n=1 Tax=Mycolicibacterium wolinskyi TaxID=59750 RepID=UPI003BAA2DA9